MKTLARSVNRIFFGGHEESGVYVEGEESEEDVDTDVIEMTIEKMRFHYGDGSEEFYVVMCEREESGYEIFYSEDEFANLEDGKLPEFREKFIPFSVMGHPVEREEVGTMVVEYIEREDEFGRDRIDELVGVDFDVEHVENNKKDADDDSTGDTER